MSDEEEDYMSDAFLKKCEDNRPGLVSKSIAARYKKIENEKTANTKSKQKSRKVQESETRTEGLQTALKSDNKGFALLQKMGYKPGTAIGKSGVGRIEPVPIEVKLNRGGLGRELELKRKSEAWSNARASVALKRRRFEERTRGEFMERLTARFTDRRSEGDLYKSQRVCEQLDCEQDISEPAEAFFWPVKPLPEPDEDEGEAEAVDVVDDLSIPEKLEILTEYLREKHIYCIWCGIKFEDFDDMEQNCPGNTNSAHS